MTAKTRSDDELQLVDKHSTLRGHLIVTLVEVRPFGGFDEAWAHLSPGRANVVLAILPMDALPATVTIRNRQGGERLRPRRGGPRRTLKSLLQESHLPVGERARLPLVFSGATLLAVGSLWLDESIQITPGAAHRGRLIHSPRERNGAS